MHAFATRRVIKSSQPYCLLEIVPCNVDRSGERGAATIAGSQRDTDPQPLRNLRLVLDIQHVRAGNHDFFQHRKRLGGKAGARVNGLPSAQAAASQRTLMEAFL